MDDALDAAAGLASVASSGLTSSTPSSKGKPRAPRKTAAPPKKKLTSEERAVQSDKRKGRRHAVNAREEVVAAAAAQQQDTNACIATTMREALFYLGLNPGEHGLVASSVASASTGSSAFPWMVLPQSARTSAMYPIPGFHVYPQASRLFGECPPEVSVMDPSTAAPAPIDLNATSVDGASSSGGTRKRTREMLDDVLPSTRNLIDTMTATATDETANRFMENITFEGGVAVAGGPNAAGYDPNETQS
ncbi:putative serine/threonine-protein kinase [Hordeum vulgare]|nr:putative serine/threonine-protein kinase [Hordeum vulgare]